MTLLDDDLRIFDAVDAQQQYPLQPVVMPSGGWPAELYFRVDSFWKPTVASDGTLHLPRGCILDFDTLTNSFFEGHWIEWTGCRASALRLIIKGEAEVHVRRAGADRRSEELVEEVATARSSADRSVLYIPIPPAPRGAASARLSFQIGTSDEDAYLLAADWVTDQPASRRVALDLVICTFNKGQLLSTLLEEITASDLLGTTLARVIVVDQGTEKLISHPGLGPASTQAHSAGLIQYFEQHNFGGSGGFTRGIMESLRTDSGACCSHLLLMDDDVGLEANLLRRLVPFLARCPANAVVGGAMMDLFRPERLYASVEAFDFAQGHCTRLQPYEHDMRKEPSLDLLAKAPTGNYNGWFMCCFPRSTFEEHGLPLPFFVRGDDCEYGLRVTESGAPLIHMPGLFVWHEPFYGKPRAWIEYYSYRNQLVVADLHTSGGRADLARKYAWVCWHYLATYQYDSALAVCLAVEDYLGGPELMFADPRPRHARLLQELKTPALEMAARTQNVRGRDAKCPRPGARSRSRIHHHIPQWFGLLVSAWWTLFGRSSPEARSAPALQAVPADALWWLPFNEFPTVVRDDLKLGTSDYLCHDPALARQIGVRMMRASLQHLRCASRMASRYRRAAPTYTQAAAWERLLGL